ncbi:MULTISPECIES: mechanosensitive ion channel domain-containing protein [Acetobacter]|uniref:DUF3772 domain-containing protein n=2 Tax=Acetobacter TaxID=434 RepID=A0AAN1U9H6_9PROT|nr:DUF3772 domain-containing protein [Acetobacter sp. DmW_125130]ASL39662.1 mechanosensitive ion channel protein MscS [Acetobacter oryzifermentans]AXN00909.1 DUF3772 domain-containing protein [Acetobacter pomorum]KAA8395851.1 DUF3772 domain-containing protein [Acetobacter sp. DmW_125124]KAA8398528.1 DUF3772 domain-containing protein [Acetobacter sp. DmW_125127]KAA8399062.1 DUF3772 domain-containing protein [Acetobacter sp. DmW_125128]KAA8402818.1 DUF3772 domain-containing protein [Acetobacter
MRLKRFCSFFLSCFVLTQSAVLFGTSSPLLAADTENAPVTAPAPTTLITNTADIVSNSTLESIGTEISAIYQSSQQERSNGQSTTELATLLRRANAVATQTDTLQARLKPYQAVYQNFLDILGKPPGKDDPAEPASITEQRTLLLKKQQDINSRMTRLKLYQVEAQQLVSELRQHGTAIQQATLWQRFPSPLGVNFWSQFTNHFHADATRFSALGGEALGVLGVAFAGKRIFISLGGIALSALLLVGWFFSHGIIRRVVVRFLPAGRIRPIIATLICGVLSLLAWGFSFQIVWSVLAFDNSALDEDLSTLGSMMGAQFPLCGLVIELGFCLLSRHPEWRIFPISDAIARNLRLFPLWLAGALIMRGFLRYIDTQSGISMLSVQLMDGLYVLAVSPLLFAIPRELRISDQTEDTLSQPSRTQFLISLAMGISIICWLAVFSGYIPLAYTIISWISMMAISMTGLLLLSLLVTAMASTLFPASAPLGRHLVELGLPPRLVNQMCVVVPGIVNVLLLAVAYAVATSGDGFDPQQIWHQLYWLFHGQASTDGSHISLDAILLCAVLPVAGYYTINILKSWFKQRFFPTTRLDIGAQASILSILSYAAWILVGLSMLAVLGVTVKSMTWVVSALSVGIGFGLQSIVQNFVSGIILMAERPVSIGDVVTIAGVTGTVERISVRSTDIRLEDKSTMIVPNSQFITSAVKNATRAQKPGVFTIELNLPFASDLDKAMDVMARTLAACKDVDESVQPSVSMSSVSDGSALLIGSAKAANGTDIKVVRSAALFEIWKAFQENKIPVTVRQNLITV